MVGWHNGLNGLDFEQTLGDGEGQESLVCCSPWDRKESDTTERLNNNNINIFIYINLYCVNIQTEKDAAESYLYVES